MLGAELAAYDQRVAAGDAPPPSVPTQPQPPSLSGLHIGATLISQSLPSGGGGHFAGMRMPQRPRMAPVAPSGVAQLPILELPEPSPHSSSLLDSRPIDLSEAGEDDEDRDEFVGGTSLLSGGVRPPPNFAYAASAPATMLWGPVGHRLGGIAMGGRTPSKTLLEAMSSVRE